MAAVEFIVVFGSIFIGTICAVFINRFLKTNKGNKINLSKDVQSEFNNLIFEKDVALEAINKINLFFSEKKIDSYEKDRLLLKYGKLLENYEMRIYKLQPSVEMQDIFLYRKQLYSLISDSIFRLDQKLDSFSKGFNNFKVDDIYNKANFKPMSDLVQKTKPIDRKSVIIDEDAGIKNKNKNNRDNNFPSNLDKVRTDLNLPSNDESPLMVSSITNKKKNIDETDTNGYEKNDVVDESSTKKTDPENLNIEDINKIQKDILQILKRLDNPSD